jgi:hypothetical protein
MHVDYKENGAWRECAADGGVESGYISGVQSDDVSGVSGVHSDADAW